MRNSALVVLVGLGLVMTGWAVAAEKAQPVHLTFLVPDEAQVWIEGALTTMPGPVREFISPAIPSGQNFVYTVRVRWQQNGQIVDQKRDITVKAGDFIQLNYTRPNGVNTSRGSSYSSRQQTPNFDSSNDYRLIGPSSTYDRRTGSLNVYGTGR